MRVQLSKKTLTQALSLVCRVIPSRSSNPLLTAVHVGVHERGLTLSGTNLEVDLQMQVPGELSFGSEARDFVLPAHLWEQMAKNAAGELIELELIGSELSMKSAGSVVRLTTGDVAAYPELSFPDAGAFAFPAADLRAALGSVQYAASHEAFQAVFRGIRLELTPTHTRSVASDGFRLAFTTLAAVQQDTHNLIIPGRSLTELLAVLKAEPGEVRVCVSDGLLTIHSERGRLNVKLMDGDFPDYRRVIPEQTPRKVTLPAAALQESLERVSLMVDSNASHRVELILDGDVLRIVAENDYGRAEDTLSCTQAGARDGGFQIAFNAKYLRDALNGRTGEITLHFSGSTTPTLVTSSGQPEQQAVVVPLRAS